MKEPLQRFGYQILETKKDDNGYFSQLSALKKQEKLYFQIERLEEHYSETFICHVKMIGFSDIDIQFTIRSNPSNYSTSIKDKGILDDYGIISSFNQDQIVEFLSNERIFPYITKLKELSIDQEISVNSKNGKFLIRIKTDCDYTKALATIPVMETLIWIFQVDKTFEELIADIGSYTCHGCQTVLSTSEKRCPNCLQITPKCVICLREPDFSRGVVQLGCCKSYAHNLELKSWFDLKNTCPYCLSDTYEIQQIE